jgi:hypothetical protein
MHHETVREPTCFGGLLARTPVEWRWSDGEAEPRMHEVPSQLGDLTCRDDFGQRQVELPICLAETFDPLGWALLAVSTGELDVDVSSGSYPSVGRNLTSSAQCRVEERKPVIASGTMIILVPYATWEKWCASCPVLPVWSVDDEPDLQRRAIDLGWKS